MLFTHLRCSGIHSHSLHREQQYLYSDTVGREIYVVLLSNVLHKYLMIYILTVSGNCENFITVQFTYLCINY